MKVVIVSKDVIVNNGIKLIIQNAIDTSESKCLLSSNIEFDFFSSFEDFNTTIINDDILLLIHYFQLNSIESNLLVKYIEGLNPLFPVVLYTSNILNDCFIQHLLCSGVYCVFSHNNIESDINQLISTVLCKSLKSIGKCSLIDNDGISNKLEFPIHDIKTTINPSFYSTTFEHTLDFSDHNINHSYLYHDNPVAVSKCIKIENYDFRKLHLQLSERKKRLIKGLILGCNNKDLASKSSLSIGTVRNYIHHLCVHFDVSNRTELAIKLRSLLES